MCDCMDLAVEVHVLGETSTAVQRTHGHAALEDEAARSLPHQEGDELHLSPVAEFRLRTKAKFMSGEDHISTLVALY